MNSSPTKSSTLIYALLIYIGGIATYGLYQEIKDSDKTDKMMLMMETDSSATDTTSVSHPCACEDDLRYNVSPKEDSKNLPISSDAACQGMVNGTTPPRGDEKGPLTIKGAWFSKITLDIMFCHKQDANGIYVYKGTDAEGQPTFIVEVARTNSITTLDDGSATMYYSKALCPTMCGVCGQ